MIEEKYSENLTEAKFSILIPTWNNLGFLQLCIQSILKNSHFKHQIIIHVNAGIDGTLEWVRSSGYSYTYSKNNIGVCWAMNAMRTIVNTEYMVFLNDDMYVCPDWDLELWKEIETLPDNLFFLSSTPLQPRKFWCKSIISPVPIGENLVDFDEKELLENYLYLPHGNWSGATWPPNIVHRDIWDLVGGYSIEFSPGLYSDPDFTAKLVLAGVRHFKGIDKSRVYHFEARSTERVKKNKGNRQFLFKWGITSSSFMHYVMHRGEPFAIREIPKFKLFFSLLRGRLKLMISVFSRNGNVKKIWKL
jgi:glycosyltransferase involved in cell wall biosynthesis